MVAEHVGWRFEHAVEQVRDQFLENIRLHLRSDVPVGAALSGGIDSSAVVCAIRHIEPELPIQTFSFIASGSDQNEEHWVDYVNAHVGAISHKVVVSPSEFGRDIDDMISTQGEPFGTTSIYAQYRVFELARQAGISVTMDGQGADELLGGYLGYPGERLNSLIDTKDWVGALRFLNNWANWPGRARLSGVQALARQYFDGTFYDCLRRLYGRQTVPDWINGNVLREMGVALRFPHRGPQQTRNGRRLMAELAASLSERNLVSLLRHGDRNSMRFSVESRVPFLTLNMAELLLTLPEEYLVSFQGETKHIFRKAKRFAISAIRVKKFCANSVYNTAIGSTGFVPPVVLEQALEKTVRHEFIESHEHEDVFFTE